MTEHAELELPSRGTLYGIFLLAQAWVRGYSQGSGRWEQGAKQLPTGLAGPRSLERSLAALFGNGLAKETEDGIQLDQRVVNAGDVPSDNTLRRILLLLVRARPPVWLLLAVGPSGDVNPELIPTAAWGRLCELGIEPAGPLGASWLPVLAARNDELAHEIGDAGEELVVRAERERLIAGGAPELAALVRRVSLIADGFGYDVGSYHLDGRERWLEVKTMRSTAYDTFGCFLTRNEARVGRAAPDQWRLVAVEYREEGYRLLGECSFQMIEPLLPGNKPGGVWVTAQLRVPVGVFS